MPVIALLVVLAGIAVVWQNHSLRAAIKRSPGQALFWALVGVAVILVSFRTGRHWLALLATGLLIWGPRLLRAIGRGAPSTSGQPPPPARPSRRMTRQEALEVLGLQEGATPEEIASQYRALMRNVHPDRGGSSYLAKRVNEAKRVLSGE